MTSANGELGSGEGGAESLNAEQNAHNASVPMDGCPPPAPAAPGRASKRRWLVLLRLKRSLLGGGIFLRISAELFNVLNERMTEHQDNIGAKLAFGDLDGGLQSGEENLGYGVAVGMLSARSGPCTSSLKSHSGEFSNGVCFFFFPATAFVWFQAAVQF